MQRRSRTDSEEYNDQSKYLYPNNEGTWFDLDYYCKVHMPMSIRMLSPALKGVSIESGLSGTTLGSKPTYIALCHLRFESVDAFLAAFSPHVLGLFSVNLRKALGAAGDADSPENAHAVREAVEFFVFGVAQNGPVNTCGGH